MARVPLHYTSKNPMYAHKNAFSQGQWSASQTSGEYKAIKNGRHGFPTLPGNREKIPEIGPALNTDTTGAITPNVIQVDVLQLAFGSSFSDIIIISLLSYGFLRCSTGGMMA